MCTKYLLLLVLVILILQLHTTIATRPVDCTPFSNGCSIPFNSPFVYRTTFTPACHRHDACYKCGVDYGKTRGECDRNFYHNMKQICRSRYFGFKTLKCRAAAKVYYLAVRVGGSRGFKTTAKSWCTRAVVPCLRNF